jgi:hypothetical protein
MRINNTSIIIFYKRVYDFSLITKESADDSLHLMKTC